MIDLSIFKNKKPLFPEALYQNQTIPHIKNGAKYLFLADLFNQTKKNILLLTEDNRVAEDFIQSLKNFLDEDNICYYPAYLTEPYEKRHSHQNIIENRIHTIYKIGQQKRIFTAASINAVQQLSITPRELVNNTITLEIGKEYELYKLIANLVEIGYFRVNIVENLGEFRHQGDIIDIFPLHCEKPLRINFFDNEIESIKYFNKNTQSSEKVEIDKITLYPANEIIASDKNIDKALKILNSINPELAEVWEEKIKNEAFFEGIENYKYYLQGHYSLLDFLPQDSIIIYNDDIIQLADFYYKKIETEYEKIKNQFDLYPKPYEYVFESNDLKNKLKKFQHKQYVSEFNSVLEEDDSSQLLDIKSINVQAKEFTKLHGLMESHLKKNYKVVVITANEVQKERMRELWYDISDYIVFQKGYISSGFIYKNKKLLIISDNEIFGSSVFKPSSYKRYRVESVEKIYSISQYHTGDYVVHIDHGIGIYNGITKITLGEGEIDCIQIEYQGNDRIFVPVDQLNLVQKFIGETEKIRVNKLGKATWKKLRKKVDEDIEKIAHELLELYAKRRKSRGYSFNNDTIHQKEMEASFPYIETEDQLRAIEEIKKDMQDNKCMDRLLCGDVGFGKTEVAIRASFKCFQDGKQTAILVPTTILAEQHYEVFRERLKNFPVKVDMVSRFRSRAAQKKILMKTASGEVDILIGTHRLLSKDVKFLNLGLMIIDEEHKFGVKHKEKLKILKNQIDVLTLTATPIPRTLQLSLSQIRDISLIETPPHDRLPVITRILPFSEKTVYNAVNKEVKREGQVFFLHNRVETIYSMAERLRELLPNVRIAVAHGQMPTKMLEDIMHEFSNHKVDLLLATMIIESGIDFPNANTIIINRADKLGLSQLYQLRGRVGRSNVQAYAYLLVPANKKLTDNASKRLRVIEEFTDLGSGIKIAFHDLNIRGAGNLLGKKQHGFMQTIGMETYLKLLERKVAELKGEEKTLYEPKIQIPIPLFISDDYIPGESLKMDFYQRMANISSTSSLERIKTEMEDRFGRLPESVQNLFHFTRIKFLSRKHSIENININSQGVLSIKWLANYSPEQKMIVAINDTVKSDKKFKYDKKGLSLTVNTHSINETLVVLNDLFNTLEK